MMLYSYGSAKGTIPYNLECSTDQETWVDVEGCEGRNYTPYPAELDGDTYKIYFRGTNNTAFATGSSRYWNLTNDYVNADTRKIACSGNAMTLLDWKKVAKGEEPEMGDYAFCHFFAMRTLTTPPELPATKLTTSCYFQMFIDSTSLTNVPALPAKTMAINCYNSMFWGCTALKTIPDLPIEETATGCCMKMFYYCSALVVNTNAPGRTWMLAPTNTVKGYMYMFSNTAGNITQKPYSSVPTAGTTYYIASAPGTDLGGNVKAYDMGNGTYAVNGEGELTKEGADKIKDKGITSLSIGAGVTKVGEEAFSYWNGLKDVTIGDDVWVIASNAFYHCTYMTNLVIGANVGAVGPTAFDRCRSLESISFGSTAAAEAAQESYKVVARITMDGETPVIDSVPEVKIDGYKKTLKGKEYLTDSEWQTVTGTLAETPYHFFKYEYVPE